MPRTAFVAFAAFAVTAPLTAQVNSFPYVESFDQASLLPAGWSANGWSISSTSPRSSPNCLSATGNTQIHLVASPVFDFGGRLPDRLTFYERRTSTALRYRLTLRATNDDSSIVIPLASWDSAAANVYVERQVDLRSSGLTGQHAWRFTWEILRDSTNSTGVLRIDDLRVLAARAIDLTPVRVEISDIRPRAGESITLTFVVANLGHAVADHASLSVQWRDRLGGLGSSSMTLSIGGTDSVRAPLLIATTQPGRLDLTAITSISADEEPSNDTIRSMITVGTPPRALVVNEIQFAPLRENEPEWVELYNPGPWTVPLSDVTCSDNSTSRVVLTSRTDELLSPGQFIVVARSEEFSTHYPDTRCLPAVFPSLNNTTPDAVVLRDIHGRTIDSAWYQPGWTTPGRTLERRDWDMSSWEAQTWGSCEAAPGATPGRVNSIQRPEIDAACGSLAAAVHPGTMSLHLAAIVRNRGRQTLPGGSVDWWLNYPDSGLGEELLLGTTLFGPVFPSDSVALEYRWTEDVRGEVQLRAVVAVHHDDHPANDTAWGELLRPYEEHSVIVNEVMLEPAPGRPEWFEIVNVGGRPVELSGWTIADLPSASGSRVRTTLPAVPLVLGSGRFAVVASDPSIVEDYPWLSNEGALVIVVPRSSGFGFNNDGDGVALSDRSGHVIDSVVVSKQAHVAGLPTAGRSLERRSLAGAALDASAWSSCADPAGATPGRRNSVERTKNETTFGVRIDPDPFSPDGDGFEDAASVRYVSNAPSLFIDARIFDLSGREVRRLADGLFVPAEGEMAWDGRNDAGRLVPIGVYIILITATDAVTGRQDSARILCSVAR